MKLNVNLLMAAAIAIGSVGAVGCKSGDAKTDKVTDTGNNAAPADATAKATPEDNPETAPVAEGKAEDHDSAATIEKDALVVSYWAPMAPPALRVEERGVAPGPGHFWRAGYWGWGGRSYNWYGGRWYAPRAGYSYYGPSWGHYGSRWGYRPGRWYRR